MAERSFPRLEDLDPRKINLDAFPLPDSIREHLQSLQQLTDDELKERAKDALYTVVGFGVLAFQRAQVLRREAAEKIGQDAPRCASDLSEFAKSIVSQVRDFVPSSARTGTTES
jgi:hypothetical protein